MQVIQTTSHLVPLTPEGDVVKLNTVADAQRLWSQHLASGKPMPANLARLIVSRWPTYWSISTAVSLRAEVLVGDRVVVEVTVTSPEDNVKQLALEQLEGLDELQAARVEALIEFSTGVRYSPA